MLNSESFPTLPKQPGKASTVSALLHMGNFQHSCHVPPSRDVFANNPNCPLGSVPSSSSSKERQKSVKSFIDVLEKDNAMSSDIPIKPLGTF